MYYSRSYLHLTSDLWINEAGGLVAGAAVLMHLLWIPRLLAHQTPDLPSVSTELFLLLGIISS
jgi:hypothetical protein